MGVIYKKNYVYVGPPKKAKRKKSFFEIMEKKQKRLMKKLRKQGKRAKPCELTNYSVKDFGRKLNKSLPKSEQWFMGLYKTHKLRSDKFNDSFGRYIPDVINRDFKYIIEIDGSIHELPEIQAKDRIKEEYYKMFGFKVFRIKAYDQTEFDNAISQILGIRTKKKIT